MTYPFKNSNGATVEVWYCGNNENAQIRYIILRKVTQV